ncbi:MAG: hypothetical protein LBM01_00385, partial [Christensenellaceae bacterium]|nr:hypothetical protein [Christensenellaceae bacterium]
MKKFFEKVKKSDFEIVRPARKWVWFAPLAILVIALIVSSFYKFQIFNLGLDFTGGTIIKLTDSEIEDDENAYKESILDILGENGVDKNKVQLVVEKSSGETSLSVKYPSVNEKTDDEMTEINEKIIADIKDAHTSATVSNADTISASASSERIINIIIAVMVSLLCILIYMLFRFKFTNGMAAVIALIHDVIIMAACVSIFRIQINSSFIAAAITIVAYSLNNTLVLFDRVRDYEKNNDPRS